MDEANSLLTGLVQVLVATFTEGLQCLTLQNTDPLFMVDLKSFPLLDSSPGVSGNADTLGAPPPDVGTLILTFSSPELLCKGRCLGARSSSSSLKDVNIKQAWNKPKNHYELWFQLTSSCF